MKPLAVKSAQRVFEILEYFEGQRRPLSLKEIVDGLHYPPSSACSLLKSLVLLGYVDYDRFSRTYMPTTRVSGLGTWVPGALFGDSGLLQMMEFLFRETDETVVLGAHSDIFAQYVHVLHPDRHASARMKAGALRPLATSGVGLALLSTRSAHVVDSCVRRINAAYVGRAPRLDPNDVVAAAQRVKAQGYAFTRGECTPGCGMIAMVLPQLRNGRQLAVGVGGPLKDLERNASFILDALRRGINGQSEDAAASAPRELLSANISLRLAA